MLALEMPRARRLLAYLAARGWLARVRRGMYITVPLEATEPSQWREDPWIVATAAFSPCYMAGLSACEHWGLTDQIFRDVFVTTAKRVQRRRLEIQGTSFRLKVLPEAKLFGTRSVWRARVRVQVSDPSRTVVDLLDEPRLGGGIRHVAEVLLAYFEGEHRDDARLVEYASRLDNRTVFKRLGYLIETLDVDAPRVLAACLERQSSGASPLDPSVHTKGRFLRRWNLRVNVEIVPQAGPG